MACDLAANCSFLFGFFSCNLPDDTINVKLTVPTLQGIHTFKKVRNTQMIRCSPWGSEIKPFPSLQRKMMEYLWQKQTITTSYQSTPGRNQAITTLSRPKASPMRKCNKTRPIKDKLSRPRKVIVGFHKRFYADKLAHHS